VDDGPETVEDALALARAAVDLGISTIVATPHVSPRYPTSADVIERGTAELNERLHAEGIPLTVLKGAEIAITQVEVLAADELERLRLGDGDWVLIECPYTPAIESFPALLGDVQSRGHRVVLAHPERCPGFHRLPDLLAELVDGGVLTSVTAGSFEGRFGRQVRGFVEGLAREGLVHNVASDAHDLTRRPPGLTAALERAGLAPFAELLTEAMPRAIVDARPLPPAPGPMEARTRRWWQRG
jgi:protein-tyrosine phosphatase